MSSIDKAARATRRRPGTGEGGFRQRLGGTFDGDVERSFNLAAPYYTRADIFEAEKDAIFYRSWQYAGPADRLRNPGDYLTVTIMDEGVVVMRGEDGRLRAFSNVCRHRAHPVLEGEGNVKQIVCPYHAWTYGLDGRLRKARASDDMRDFDASKICLPGFRVETFCGLVFVNLDTGAAPLKEQTGDLDELLRGHVPELDALRWRKRLVHEVHANWKVLADNFLECYHCHLVHPALVDLHDMSTYKSTTYDIHSTHVAASRKGDNAAFRYEPKGNDVGFAGAWIWPTTTIGVYAGEGNAVVNHFVPRGPELTDAIFDIYYATAEETPQQAAAIRYLDDVLQPEDTRVCDAVQRGLRSQHYLQSRYVVDDERSYVSEHSLHHFHGLYLQAMEGFERPGG